MTAIASVRNTLLVKRGLIYAFLVGMLVGPFVSSYFGIQVMSRNAKAELETGMTEVQASICDALARADVKQTTQLDWNARRELATKYAVMPGRKNADSGVVSLCSDKLAAS
jgi:hypothetical protein